MHFHIPGCFILPSGEESKRDMLVLLNETTQSLNFAWEAKRFGRGNILDDASRACVSVLINEWFSSKGYHKNCRCFNYRESYQVEVLEFASWDSVR